MAAVVLAMMFRYADGSFTFNFWYVSGVALLMVVAGIWSLVSPEAFRGRYFKFVRNLTRVLGSRTEPPWGWGWRSPTSIRLTGAVGIALAAGFMTWVVFFTVPGRTY